MREFISELPILLMAALLIALIACIYAFAAIKNEKTRKKSDEERIKGVSCSGCRLSGVCSLSKDASSKEPERLD